MRWIIGTLLLSTAVLASPATWAQPNPTTDQITQALSRPASPAGPSSSGLAVTPGMLRGPTRGIMLPGAMPATSGSATSVAMHVPAGAVKGADACTAGSGTCALVVQFQTGSDELTPAAMATLDSLGKALSAPSTSGFKFQVVGHTDTVGSRDLNLSLSDRRAQAVAAYLEQHFNIASARLQPVGVGKDQLLVPTPDQIPEPRNRRVQVINVGA